MKTIYLKMRVTAAVLVAATMASCVGEDELDPTPSVSDDGTIRIATVVTPPTGEQATRGELIASQSEMTDFGLYCTYTGAADWAPTSVYAQIVNAKMVKSGQAEGRYDYWAYTSGSPFRWNTGASATANDRYTFFAYAPFESAATGISAVSQADVTSRIGAPAGIPYIRYIAPADITAQPDLMVATQRSNVRPTGNPVSITMNHALAAVRFRAYGNGEQIASIAVTGFCDRGVRPLGGDDLAWDMTRVAADGTLLSTPLASPPLTDVWFEMPLVAGAAASDTGDVMPDGEWMTMIPQTLTSAALVQVTFSDGTPTMTFSLDTQVWTAGSRKTFALEISEPPVVGNDVLVGTLLWAGRNVATAGTFAATPLMYDDRRSQYQFDRVVANDNQGVCPTGWRAPSQLEMQALIDAATTSQWVADYNNSGINGWKFVVPNGILFFAASGYNQGTNVGVTGYYRSSSERFAGSGTTYQMRFNDSPSILSTATTANTFSTSVRCVQPQQVTPEPLLGDDILVGTLLWAGRNVATTGTFAVTPLMYDGTNKYNFAQASANGNHGVCPSGWRLPTQAETQALIDTATGSQFINDYNASGINGWEFVVPNGTLFFSTSGYNTSAEGRIGWYRSSTVISTTNSYSMQFDNTPTVPSVLSSGNQQLYSVRCVQPQVTPNPLGEVVVGNVAWAMTNVAALGTFAPTDDVYDGADQYTWDQATGGVSDDATAPGCPVGWRLPTAQEYYDLMAAATNTGTPSGTMTPAGGGMYLPNSGYGANGSVNGMRVDTAGGSLFFPASGTADTGGSEGSTGYYYSGTQINDSTVYYMLFMPALVQPGVPTSKTVTLSIRCVHDVIP